MITVPYERRTPPMPVSRRHVPRCNSVFEHPEAYRHLCVSRPGHPGEHRCWDVVDGVTWSMEQETKRLEPDE